MHLRQTNSDLSPDNVLKRAVETLKLEGDAIHNLANNLGNEFVSVVSLILESTGRIVMSGVGKSADVARKIVATLNSTGSPAIFVHAGDAVHGDLGGIQDGDVVLCLSKSGKSSEISALTPLIRASGHSIVAITGSKDSELARIADHVILAGVGPEACPFDLAPTTSTTVQMALGDALAICLMEAKGFGADDFAKNHPGGTLGKRLTTRVSDLTDPSRKPSVSSSATLQEILLSMTAGRYGATVVLDSTSGKDEISGIITDGDLRRALESGLTSKDVTASDIMGKSPLSISGDALATEAASAINSRGVSQIIALDPRDQYAGIVHLHDLIKEGIVN